MRNNTHLVQVLVPVLFFGLMCIPKHYIKPQPLPRQILSYSIDLDMGLASKPGSTDYSGMHNLHLLGFLKPPLPYGHNTCQYAHIVPGDTECIRLCAGPASVKEQATILYAPNSTEGNALMRRVAQAAACPADGTRKSSTSASFYRCVCHTRAALITLCGECHQGNSKPINYHDHHRKMPCSRSTIQL